MVEQKEIIPNSMHFDDEATNMQDQSLEVKNMTASQAMIMHCTHPPSTHAEFQGLPTNDARSQVVTTWRTNEVIRTPAYSDGDKLVETDWQKIQDYGIIIPNGARVKYIGAYYRQAGTGQPNSVFVQDVANTAVQDVFDFSIWWKTVNLYRPVAKSTTLYANVTMFNNTGTMNCQQFNPAILFAGTLAEFSWQMPQEFVHFIRSGYERGEYQPTKDEIHTDFNSHPFDHFFREQNIKPSGLTIDPSTTIQVVNFGRIGYESDSSSIMPSPGQMISNSSRSYAGKFQDGLFTVQRLNTLTPKWLAGSRPDKNKDTPWFGLYECYVYTVGPDTFPSFVPLQDKIGDKLVNLRDTLWSPDMTWSFVRCQGLSPINTANGANAAKVGPIIAKTYYSMESQPVAKGAWNGLSRVSPEPDMRAMQALMDAFFKMPDGMPSKYNFLGSVLPFLKSALPIALPFIGKLFKGEKREEKEVVREDRKTDDSVSRLTALVERLLRRPNAAIERLPAVSAARTQTRRRPLAVGSPVAHRRLVAVKAKSGSKRKAV